MSRDYDAECPKCKGKARTMGVYDYKIGQCMTEGCGYGWFVIEKVISTKANGIDEKGWEEIAAEVYSRIKKEKKKMGVTTESGVD